MPPLARGSCTVTKLDTLTSYLIHYQAGPSWYSLSTFGEESIVILLVLFIYLFVGLFFFWSSAAMNCSVVYYTWLCVMCKIKKGILLEIELFDIVVFFCL